MKRFVLFFLFSLFSIVLCISISVAQSVPEPPLWQVYQQSFKSAKYEAPLAKADRPLPWDQQRGVRVR